MKKEHLLKRKFLLNNFSHRIFSIRLLFNKILLKGSFPIIIIAIESINSLEVITNHSIVRKLDRKGRKVLIKILNDLIKRIESL